MCLFCEVNSIMDETPLAYAIYDKFPVTKYHTLIIPKRHVAAYFDLTPQEIVDIHTLLNKQQNILVKADLTILGFNIGINCGQAAGQTIFHCHVHLIPRRIGDVEKPTGGIRNIIPHKGDYTL